MGSFRLEISATAERQLRGLPRRDLPRVVAAIEHLATEPYPRGMRKLGGYEDVYRLRVGRYRILYSVERRRVVVVVLKIGQRKDVYR